MAVVSSNILRRQLLKFCFSGRTCNGRSFKKSAAFQKSKPICDTSIPDGYFKLKDIQKQFQKNDGLPVYLKAGYMDRLLFRTTVGLSIAGLLGVVKLIYDLGFAALFTDK